MYDERQYQDLNRTDIATYNFRGYRVILFEKQSKRLYFGSNHDQCNFIVEDLKLMSEFLDRCYKYAKGEIEDVTHIKVG
jgi:hypothetical protein